MPQSAAIMLPSPFLSLLSPDLCALAALTPLARPCIPSSDPESWNPPTDLISPLGKDLYITPSYRQGWDRSMLTWI